MVAQISKLCEAASPEINLANKASGVNTDDSGTSFKAVLESASKVDAVRKDEECPENLVETAELLGADVLIPEILPQNILPAENVILDDLVAEPLITESVNPVEFISADVVVSEYPEDAEQIPGPITEVLFEKPDVEPERPIADVPSFESAAVQEHAYADTKISTEAVLPQNTPEPELVSEKAEYAVNIKNSSRISSVDSESGKTPLPVEAEAVNAADAVVSTPESYSRISSETDAISPEKTDTNAPEGLTQYVTSQVVSEITENLSDVSAFRNEFSFTLNPENLGKVAVRMVIENGTLTVELYSNNKETQSILASNLESIKEILKGISEDSQVNQIAQETAPDYLQQHSEGNERNPHYSQSHETPAEEENTGVTYTEDFISMLSLLSTENL